ncbi:MAG TPA: FGGY-family carbohydrate kinase [Spirochaetia bacterium]|nr:FGGY-family carbohydrate kinase [Spirochaetia bacterium]
MTGSYLLGVDIGSSSSTGVLVDRDGAIVHSHTIPHGMDMPRPGFFEHDADRIWWREFVDIVGVLLDESAIDPRNIIGIGTSAIGSCVLPIDASGKPLRPAILYGIDTRASSEIEQLEQLLGKEEIFFRSASNLSSQASGPKILWIRNHEPEIYNKTRWFLTSQAYLVYKLTGTASIDVYTASGYTPLFDPYSLGWNEDFARPIVPVERLPEVFWSCTVVGSVSPQAARATGLAEGTAVIAGTTDAAAEAVSAGVVENGDMMIMFGSSIFFIMKSSKLLKTPDFWCSNFLEPDTYAFAGGMSTAGSLTTWFRDQFARAELDRENDGGENAYALLAREAAASPPGANGCIALPYFEGERTPLNDPKARGLIFGLRLGHNRGDLYRALLEGVGFGIRHNLEAMSREGVEPERLLAVGGGCRNALWMQLVSDILGRELAVPEQQIGASYGDAFMAAVGAGLFPDLSAIRGWVRSYRVFRPEAQTHERYGRYYRIFLGLYESTKELMHQLSDPPAERP